jgi:hypothetical protein
MDSKSEMHTPAEQSPVMVTSMRVANAIHGLLTDPQMHMSTLSRAIHVEPCISAAVLRVANSAAYGLDAQVTDLTHAIGLIGTAKVRVLALQIVLRQLVEGIQDPLARKVAETVWSHSIELGCLAEQIALVRGVDGNYCHVLALFHDLPAFQILNESRVSPEAFVSEAAMVEFAHGWHGPSAARLGMHMGLPDEMIADLRRLDDRGSSTPVVDVMRAAHGCCDVRYPFDRFSGPPGWDAPDEVVERAQEKMDSYLDMVRLR